MAARSLVLAMTLAASLIVGVPGPAAAGPLVAAQRCTLELDLTQEPTPIGTGTCPGVRPGAYVVVGTSGCTFNFVYTGIKHDAAGNVIERRRYIGTAGHCVDGADDREVVFDPGEGPVAYEAGTRRIGYVEYAINNLYGDIALIRLDDGVQANAQMCHFGGPIGLGDPDLPVLGPETGSKRVPIRHFGQGLVYGDTIPARSGVAYYGSTWDYVAAGAALFGDSGSGVTDDSGRAIGVLVAISPLGVHLSRLASHLERARVTLGLDGLTVETAPTL